MTPSPVPKPSDYTTIGAAAALVAILGALFSVVWSQSAQSSQVQENRAAINKLECLPVQVARVEAMVDAQSEQLTRIEDSLKQRKE